MLFEWCLQLTRAAFAGKRILWGQMSGVVFVRGDQIIKTFVAFVLTVQATRGKTGPKHDI